MEIILNGIVALACRKLNGSEVIYFVNAKYLARVCGNQFSALHDDYVCIAEVCISAIIFECTFHINGHTLNVHVIGSYNISFFYVVITRMCIPRFFYCCQVFCISRYSNFWSLTGSCTCLVYQRSD